MKSSFTVVLALTKLLGNALAPPAVILSTFFFNKEIQSCNQHLSKLIVLRFLCVKWKKLRFLV